MSLSIDDIIWVHYHEFLELSISPDDQEVLVVFGNHDMPHDSYAMDQMNRSMWKIQISDGQAVQLAGKEEDAHIPRWSPDGQSIAYLSRRSGKTEIWVMNADGTDARQATQSPFPAQNPFDGSSLYWAPDGKSIAYTVVPNGGRYALATASNDTLREVERDGKVGQVTVQHAKSNEEGEETWNHPPSFKSSVYVVHPESGQSRHLVSQAEEEFRILGWFPGGEELLVGVGSELKAVAISTGKLRTLFSGPFDLVEMGPDGIRMARLADSHLEVGLVEGGSFRLEHSIEVPGYEPVLDTWSQDGSKLYGRIREGMSTYLILVDLKSGQVEKLTPKGKTAGPSGAKPFMGETAVVFPCQSPTEPAEVWLHRLGAPSKRISHFNRQVAERQLPEVRIIQYYSGGWTIEALLVLPVQYVPGRRYPTLVHVHGGPESFVGACFTHLVSARAEGAALFLAAQGYAVLLPNFRGSSGYGPEFERELADYQITKKPFQDVMAGIDHLIKEGIADPDSLGIYGDSFGGWLTAWAVSQTRRFKGAVAAIGLYDLLHFDRSAGTPFCSWQPNRLGNADPAALWNHPEVYREFSPMEHITAIKTPVLIIETAGERRGSWYNQGSTLFNGLCASGIESYLVYYPKAHHNGGWNDEYKRDYMSRLVTWFDHCLKGDALPEWFKKSGHNAPV